MVVCAALLLLGMLAGALITFICRRPLVITVQLPTPQDSQDGFGKSSSMPGSGATAMPRSSTAKAKRVSAPVKTQSEGTFFKNRHLYTIFLDDGETVFHKTSECAGKCALHPELNREVVPCGVCRAVASDDCTLYLSKYGEKFHTEDCKHVQQRGSKVHGITPCAECWSGPRIIE